MTETRFGASINLKGNNILKLGTGAKSVPDLVEFLYSLKTNITTAGAYSFVGDPVFLNIAIGSYGANNVDIIPDALKNPVTGVEFSQYAPTRNFYNAGFDYNTITHQFNGNKFGYGCTRNVFKAGFATNQTGDYFGSNTFEANCYNNIFGNRVTNFTIGATFVGNVVGNNCSYIVAANNVNNCNIGTGCAYVNLGASCTRVTLINCVGTADKPIVIPANSTDVTYVNGILTDDPYNVASRLSKLANLSDVADKKAALRNLGLTDQNGMILPALVAGGVAELNDSYPTLAALQAAIPVGSKTVLYITTDQDLQFRWSGTAYRQFFANPGTTDAVIEGVKNLYFTAIRAIGSVLTGYVKPAAARAIAVGDTILTAIGILEKKADDNADAIAFIKQSLLPISQSFDKQLVVTIAHNRNRLVFVKVCENDGFETYAEIDQSNLNSIKISFSDPTSGNIVLF